MVDLEFMTPAVTLEDKEWLQDAKLKLEEVSEIDPDDYNAMFDIGMVHYYILENNPPRKHNYWYMKLCNEAISYFKEVRNKAPEVYKDSMLEKMRAFLPIVLKGGRKATLRSTKSRIRGIGE